MDTLKNFTKFSKGIDHEYLRDMQIKIFLISLRQEWSAIEFATELLLDLMEEEVDLSKNDEAYYIASAAFNIFSLLGEDENINYNNEQ